MYEEFGSHHKDSVTLRDVTLEIVMNATGLLETAALRSPAYQHVLDSLAKSTRSGIIPLMSECPSDVRRSAVSPSIAQRLKDEWHEQHLTLKQMVTGLLIAESISAGAHSQEKVTELRQQQAKRRDELELYEGATAAIFARIIADYRLTADDIQRLGDEAVQKYGHVVPGIEQIDFAALITGLRACYLTGTNE